MIAALLLLVRMILNKGHSSCFAVKAISCCGFLIDRCELCTGILAGYVACLV
jgi:hypothetical protein